MFLPKDSASLRILSANSVAYLDLTGSGMKQRRTCAPMGG